MNILYFWNKFLKKLRCAAIKDSCLHKTVQIGSGSLIINSSFGKHSFCGYDCEIINCNIGKFCSIANNVIIGGSMHPLKWGSTSPAFYDPKDGKKAKLYKSERDKDLTTEIGHDVWIGQYAMIKQGVTIGNGAVIGMGSIVTKNVAPYSIVAGNPAKLIRMRFPENIIAEYEKKQWRNLSDKDLKESSKLIKDPVAFIKSIKK